MGISHVARPDIGTGNWGLWLFSGIWSNAGTWLWTLKAAMLGKSLAGKPWECLWLLGIFGLTSVHGVILCGFVTKLPSRHCSSHSCLEHSFLLCPCCPTESAAPSVPDIFFVPSACFGCGCWHFQFFLGLFFNYVTSKQPKDPWGVVQLRTGDLHSAL